MRLSRRSSAAVAGLSAAILLAAIFHSAWLTWLGSRLVEQQAPDRRDVVIVLGGDHRGGRILKAAELACRGYAPHVLVSGSGEIYGKHESDLAVAFAVEKGFREQLFWKLHYPAASTRDEARAVIRQLHQLHIRNFLLVTSSFHTHRAANIFRDEAPDLPFRVIASSDPDFTPGSWWKTREGQKVFVTEWTKTVANWFGI